LSAVDAATARAPATSAATTDDAVFGGAVRLRQPRRGPRVSLDAVLLVRFAAPARGRVVDLGAGAGAVALGLARIGRAAQVVAVERDAAQAALVAHNAAANGVADRVRALAADVREAARLLGRDAADLVVTNPPFRARVAGSRSPDAARAAAAHESDVSLEEWVEAAAHLLRSGGRLCLIHTATRLPAVLAAVMRAGLVARRIRFVHPLADRPARRVLVEARRGGASGTLLAVEPPLVVHVALPGRGHAFSDELRCLVGSNGVD
jgi:tRNA1(Val) A37 N6-methylase TrmN6